MSERNVCHAGIRPENGSDWPYWALGALSFVGGMVIGWEMGIWQMSRLAKIVSKGEKRRADDLYAITSEDCMKLEDANGELYFLMKP